MQNTTPPVQDQRDNDEIDLLALIGALLDGKWIIMGITLLFTLIGVTYALLATPIYEANALLQIEEKSSNMTGLNDMGEMFGGASAAVTEIELLKSRTVIGQAVENLKLDIISEPKYFPGIGAWAARRFVHSDYGNFAKPWLGMDSFAWGGERLDIFQLEVPNKYLGKTLILTTQDENSFTLHDQNNVLLLGGNTAEPIISGDFKVQVAELKARSGTEFLVSKAKTLNSITKYQAELGATEKGRDSGIISLTLKHESPMQATRILNEVSRLYVLQNVARNSAEAAQSLEFIREQLPNVRRELERYEQALNDYQISTNSVDISIETQSILDQIVQLDTMISQQNLRRTEMERRFTREHPNYQAMLEQMQQLERQKTELEAQVGELPSTQQELLRLKRDVAVTTEIYTAMLNSSQELDIMRAGTVGNVRIIDEAAANAEQPVEPRKALIIVLATLLGGFISVSLVLMRHTLNRGVQDPDVIEQLGLPVYAAIPFSKDQEVLEKHIRMRHRDVYHGSLLLAVSNPADLSIESLRSLRTSLHFASLEAKNNILMISGPSPSVGKSFVSVNLATIIAQAGQKVLLIDGDMRKGYLNKMFRIAPENGLSELLSARISSNDAIHSTEVENLHIIPRGQIPPNPSELLMHANFSSFLENVKDEYDIIIIDTPPVLAVTDAAIVGRQVGMSLIVARFGLNSAKEIEVTKRRFEQNDIQLKGAIFNAVEKRASSYGYGNYGYYNYEYKSDKT